MAKPPLALNIGSASTLQSLLEPEPKPPLGPDSTLGAAAELASLEPRAAEPDPEPPLGTASTLGAIVEPASLDPSADDPLELAVDEIPSEELWNAYLNIPTGTWATKAAATRPETVSDDDLRAKITDARAAREAAALGNLLYSRRATSPPPAAKKRNGDDGRPTSPSKLMAVSVEMDDFTQVDADAHSHSRIPEPIPHNPPHASTT